MSSLGSSINELENGFVILDESGLLHQSSTWNLKSSSDEEDATYEDEIIIELEQLKVRRAERAAKHLHEARDESIKAADRLFKTLKQELNLLNTLIPKIKENHENEVRRNEVIKLLSHLDLKSGLVYERADNIAANETEREIRAKLPRARAEKQTEQVTEFLQNEERGFKVKDPMMQVKEEAVYMEKKNEIKESERKEEFKRDLDELEEQLRKIRHHISERELKILESDPNFAGDRGVIEKIRGQIDDIIYQCQKRIIHLNDKSRLVEDITCKLAFGFVSLFHQASCLKTQVELKTKSKSSRKLQKAFNLNKLKKIIM